MKFPIDFQAMLKNPATKAAFIRQTDTVNPIDCQNCGGAGTMHIFIATGGPFRDPPGAGKVGHHHKDKWYQGQTFSGECPECGGLGHLDAGSQISAPPADTINAQGELIDRFEHVRKPYAEGD